MSLDMVGSSVTAVAPLPITKPSPDLVEGVGRRVRRMGKLSILPTVEWIAQRWASSSQAIIEVNGMWIMRRWKTKASDWFVTPTDAASIDKNAPSEFSRGVVDRVAA